MVPVVIRFSFGQILIESALQSLRSGSHLNLPVMPSQSILHATRSNGASPTFDLAHLNTQSGQIVYFLLVHTIEALTTDILSEEGETFSRG